jgi:SNF2 family DNA or RNA helicase
VEECPDKLLVFASFTSVLTMLNGYYKNKVPCELVTGGTSLKERNRIFTAFQEEEDPKIIFADPGCMSHGLTLTRATITCWWGPTDKTEIYTQANYRIDRPGKTKDTYIVQLGSCPVEWEIYERLSKRQNLQGVMLRLMENEE